MFLASPQTPHLTLNLVFTTSSFRKNSDTFPMRLDITQDRKFYWWMVLIRVTKIYSHTIYYIWCNQNSNYSVYRWSVLRSVLVYLWCFSLHLVILLTNIHFVMQPCVTNKSPWRFMKPPFTSRCQTKPYSVFWALSACFHSCERVTQGSWTWDSKRFHVISPQ